MTQVKVGEEMVELDGLSHQETLEVKIALEETINDINKQIAIRGKKAEKWWLNRAKRSKRHIAQSIQRVNWYLGQHNHKLKMERIDRAEIFEKHFIDIARETLEDETYDLLIELTKKRMEGLV